MTTVSDFTSESIFFDKGEYDLVNLTPDLSDQKGYLAALIRTY